MPPGISVALTGGARFGYDGQSSLEPDILRSDEITLPVSLLVLAFCLRSGRAIILTVLCLAMALLGSVAAVWPLAVAQPVPSFVISLMIALVIAMSLDYSLFHLTCLQERILARAKRLEAARGCADEGQDPPASADMPLLVKEVLHSAGHMIVTSGLTLSACLFALAFFPLAILRWAGVSGAFAVLSAMGANLTLVPAALLAFPRFFTGEACFGCCGLTGLGARISAAAPAGWSIAKLDDAATRAWYAAASAAVRWRWSVAVGLTLFLVVPTAPQMRLFSPGVDYTNDMPKGD